MRTSREYRSILRDCQEQVDKEIAQGRGQLEQQSEILYKFELIWNLIEILCIEKPASKHIIVFNCLLINESYIDKHFFIDGIILPQLLQWISFHFPQADEKCRLINAESPERPEAHPDFWEAMTIFILQGRKNHAQKLLRLHSQFGEGNLHNKCILVSLFFLFNIVHKFETY